MIKQTKDMKALEVLRKIIPQQEKWLKLPVMQWG